MIRCWSFRKSLHVASCTAVSCTRMSRFSCCACFERHSYILIARVFVLQVLEVRAQVEKYRIAEMFELYAAVAPEGNIDLLYLIAVVYCSLSHIRL